MHISNEISVNEMSVNEIGQSKNKQFIKLLFCDELGLGLCSSDQDITWHYINRGRQEAKPIANMLLPYVADTAGV